MSETILKYDLEQQVDNNKDNLLDEKEIKNFVNRDKDLQKLAKLLDENPLSDKLQATLNTHFTTIIDGILNLIKPQNNDKEATARITKQPSELSEHHLLLLNYYCDSFLQGNNEKKAEIRSILQQRAEQIQQQKQGKIQQESENFLKKMSKEGGTIQIGKKSIQVQTILATLGTTHTERENTPNTTNIMEWVDNHLQSIVDQLLINKKPSIKEGDASNKASHLTIVSQLSSDEVKLLTYYQNKFPQQKEINDILEARKNLMKTRVTMKINQEVSNSLDDPIKNLEELGINTNTQPNRITLKQHIHTAEDVYQINATNLRSYLNKKNYKEISEENYPYIINNLRQIIQMYITVYPEYKNVIGDKKENMQNVTLSAMGKRNQTMLHTYQKLGLIIKKGALKDRIIQALNTNDASVVDLWIKHEIEQGKKNTSPIINSIIDSILPGSNEMEVLYSLWQKSNNPIIKKLIQLHAESYLKGYIINWTYDHRLEKNVGQDVTALSWKQTGDTEKRSYQFLKRDAKDKEYYEHFRNKGLASFDALYHRSQTLYESMYNNYHIDRSIPISDVLYFRSLVQGTMSTLTKSRNSFAHKPEYPKEVNMKNMPTILTKKENDYLLSHATARNEYLSYLSDPFTLTRIQKHRPKNEKEKKIWSSIQHKMQKNIERYHKEVKKNEKEYNEKLQKYQQNPKGNDEKLKIHNDLYQTRIHYLNTYYAWLLKKSTNPTSVANKGIDIRGFGWIRFDFSQKRTSEVVRDSDLELTIDKLNENRQGTFGTLVEMGVTVGVGAATGWISLLAAAAIGLAAGRVANGIAQEAYNAYEAIQRNLGYKVNDLNNGVDKVGEGFRLGTKFLKNVKNAYGEKKGTVHVTWGEFMSTLVYDYTKAVVVAWLWAKIGDSTQKMIGKNVTKVASKSIWSIKNIGEELWRSITGVKKRWGSVRDVAIDQFTGISLGVGSERSIPKALKIIGVTTGTLLLINKEVEKNKKYYPKTLTEDFQISLIEQMHELNKLQNMIKQEKIEITEDGEMKMPNKETETLFLEKINNIIT